MNDKIFDEIDKLIEKSLKHNEVPIVALVLKDNIIISKAYNKRNKTKNVLKHAEIIAIEKASKKLKNWRLNDCEMVVTLEPCAMCKRVIEEARISKVDYLLKRNAENKNKTMFNQINTGKNLEYEKILKNFFKLKR